MICSRKGFLDFVLKWKSIYWDADSAIPQIGNFQTSYVDMLTEIIAWVSVILVGENENGIYNIPIGPMLNLFHFKSNVNIVGSGVSNETITVVGSQNGFLKLSILEVLFPTEVDIGNGSIIVGNNPLPSQ